ncbi:MAG: hypothetical protein JXC85_05340 [Candidatus Aenigmarchaeota archaeon]|nr:hypothetical protein [Candidatus Aenigmarchaeota archaeon]
MKNRVVGFLIIGVAALIGFIIYSFNIALYDIIDLACSHGPSCPMWGTLSFQTNVSLAIMVFIVMIGLYLIFFGKDEKIITKVKRVSQQIDPKNITKENYRKILSELGSDERLVFEKIIEAKGSVFQSELVTSTGLNKVKVTRVLDRLDGRSLIERKRRGMTNIVVLKHRN